MTQAATSTAADDSTTAQYNYAYTITGNVQTEQINLAAMSKEVTLAADYDYNNNLTTLAANIGGDYGRVRLFRRHRHCPRAASRASTAAPTTSLNTYALRPFR